MPCAGYAAFVDRASRIDLRLKPKPIIDIILAVANSADESAYVPPLEDAGFAQRIREPDRFEHRISKSPVIAGKVPVFSRGSEEITRILAFRDWLRTNDAERTLHENAKSTPIIVSHMSS